MLFITVLLPKASSPMTWIDSHCHLFSKKFASDRPAAAQRAREAGVSHIFLPDLDNESTEDMLATAEAFPDLCYPMVGIHPCHVTKNFEQQLYQVENWLARETFYGIGETGLDLYWDKTLVDYQKEALKIQVGLAAEHDLPLILHTRDAFHETLQLIQENWQPGLKGIFHCFVDTAADAQKVIDLGFKVGLGGVLTFKNTKLGAEAAQIPLEHIVVETDAPYLAPHPHRGKRNEPAYVALVGQRLAEVQQKSEEEVAEQTTANALKLFKLTA